MELRLLTDPAFVEEFDMVVEEITDQYVRGELQAQEREQVEQYFLKASERRKQVQFASALIDHASVARGEKAPAPTPAPKTNTLLDRLFSFWNTQSFAFRAATAMVTVAIIAGLAYVIRPGLLGSQTSESIELAISYAERGEGSPTKHVKLAPETDVLRIRLNLPEQLPQANNYRVELVDEKGAKRNLEIVEQRSRTITAAVPASELPPGRYALHLSVVNNDGTVQRLPGTYRFDIE